MDSHTSHLLALWAARSGFFPREKSEDPPLLSQQCWGKEFPNPIGLAAGFDKNAESVEGNSVLSLPHLQKGLSDLGFGFIEIGSVTPLPQEGNPKPRVFRLVEDGAVINRYGFNSQGHAEVAKRLSVLPAYTELSIVHLTIQHKGSTWSQPGKEQNLC